MKRLVFVVSLLFLISPVVAQTIKWKTTRSVRKELKNQAKQGNTFYSQFDWYSPRDHADLKSQYSDYTGKELLIYGVDFYYASGSWFSELYKNKCRDNLISIVKEAWRKYRAFPSFSWHLENPYASYECNEYMGCRYRYAPNAWPNYPQEHQYVIREIIDGTGGFCGFGRYKQSDSKEGYSNPRVWFEDRCKEVASIINELKSDSGLPIPIIFRLWHECEDTWNWWGTSSCSDDEYKEFFVLTERLIKKYSPRARILWGYCTDCHWANEENYLRRYPGDKYVDIMGYDDYEICGDSVGFANALARARCISKIANSHKKIAAIFETCNRIPEYSEIFFQGLISKLLEDNKTELGLFQMWTADRFSTKAEKEDRAWILDQPYIISTIKERD